jgi:hypothetical protein
MNRIYHVLLAACLVLLAGCSDEETFSRYPSVSIPEYGKEDYIRDISDPDSELVYNAICNLGRSARQCSKTLCAEDADPASPEYQRADKVYRAVCSQLEAKEPHVVAASLRFLQVFAKEYKSKEELVEIVSRVESRHPQVQFEQVTLLRPLVSESSKLPEPLLRRLLNSPSWIVSRSAYGLIGRLHEEPLRQELVSRYRNTEDEKERLILIMALRNRLEPEEARMLEQEMLSTENSKIRHATGMALVKNVDCPGVKPWLTDHFPHFSDKEKSWMLDQCDDDDLIFWFLSQGAVPGEELLKELVLVSLIDDGETEAELRRFEEAIQANAQLAGRWQTMKEEAVQKQARMNALHEDMVPLSQEFTNQLQVLLAKHEMPAPDQKKAMEKISKALASLTGED